MKSSILSARNRLTSDLAQMRRARRLYVYLAVPWIEADRERIFDFVEMMKAKGLYSMNTADCDVRHSVVNLIGRAAGVTDYHARNAWLLRTGWHCYRGPYVRRKIADAKAGVA